MANALAKELNRGTYDVVVASQLYTAPYLSNMLTPPKIFEEVELTLIKEQYTRASTRPTRLRSQVTWLKHKQYMGWLLPQFDSCSVVSEIEKNHVREAAPQYDRVAIIPNGVDMEALRLSDVEPQPQTLVFNGALTYKANHDGMRYFLKEIWPSLRIAESHLNLSITGSTKGVDLSQLQLSDGVTLTGYVPDIRPIVAGAWACVVPLRIGGGTRLKILEAMALGTPVIATTKGAEGIAVMPEENILIADDPTRFVAQTVRLLHDADLRKRLSENGRRLIEEKYNWQTLGDQFNALIESVVSERRIL
jgi:glycosyltransferase involved in cell wall biosynthesis